MVMRRRWGPVLPVIFGVFIPLWLGAADVARADQIGLLGCNVAPGVGLIITSSRALSCRFSRSYGPPDYYVGTITNFGLDLGATGAGRLAWQVYAATREPGRYALAGQYGGASADVSFGPGFGANALVGGNGRSISLQPLSVNAQPGVDITAGVTGLTLEPSPRHPGY
jgi:hypothetical protein